ncbi:hypothetical protein C1646_768153 [Rhizophagus diaphanus]|nr:hypothetical protein C1646_768153 [Rhizophagus diaphanus] [Rhizophagus sp. MUCL 43196]
MGNYSEYSPFNNRRGRSQMQLYNILSIEIGLSASTLASFYRHQKSPSMDKIIEWIEKEGNKKSVSFSDRNSSNSSNNSSNSGEVSVEENPQTEHSWYLAELKEQLKLNVQRAEIAFNAFETEKKSQVVRSFWKEIEEKNAIQTASLGHLNIFGRALTQYAHAQEVSTEGVKLPTPQKRENETEGIELPSKKSTRDSESQDSDNSLILGLPDDPPEFEIFKASDDDSTTTVMMSVSSEIVPVLLISVFSDDKTSTSTKEIEDKKPTTKKQYITRDIASYKRDEAGKSPISIGVINFYNTDCTKYLPLDYKIFIANQLQDKEIRAVNFIKGRTIDKFLVNSSSSTLLLLVQNDTLLQALSEREFNSLIWRPLLRNAFLGKTDIKFNYGELASISYNKLKEILNIAGKSGPKLDGKAFLRSLGTEVLTQEDGILNTRGKRKARIIDIETYCLQSNGFQLTISASKYLFENTIITMDLQDIEVPRTVEAFSKFITAVKVIYRGKQGQGRIQMFL